jgi:phosphate transport system substrate-binding protein
MSRAMKQEELDAFEKKYGYKPTEIKVAVDALAVFVPKDNAIKGLTLTQVDSIFSTTRKRGGQDITTWDQLGLKEWTGRAISLYGRNSASGTYGFFKEHALEKGDFKTTVKEQPGSSAVVQGVTSDQYGIGYSGIGYGTSGVRAVPLGKEDGNYAEATYANCLSGDYPMARFLYVYINKKPGAGAGTLISEFVKFVASKQGQQIVVKDGYFPVPVEIATESVEALK